MIDTDDNSFVALFVAHPIPMWVYDKQTLRFLAINSAAVQHYGYSEDEFLGMTIGQLRAPPGKVRRGEPQRPPPTRENTGLRLHLKKDGTLIDVDVSAHPLWFRERACKFVMAHDVSGRLQADARVVRLSRICAVLSSINSAIVRTHERATLFRETCRIATVEGEFLGVCIVAIDPVSGAGSVAARAGVDCSPFALRIVASPEADSAGGTPPWHALWRRGSVVCNTLDMDTLTVVRKGPDVAPASAAMAVFPLVVRERVVAVLMLLADAPDYFDAAELKLLEELAADVAFALLFIEQQQESARVTSRLRESEAGLRRAQIMNRSAHVISASDGAFESWSESLGLLIGLAPAALPTSTRGWIALVYPDDRAAFRAVCKQAGRSTERVTVDYRVRRSDGALVQLRQIMEPLPESDEALTGTRWFNTIQDVTLQMQQQDRLARLSRIYAVSSGINAAIARIHTREALFQEACRVAVEIGAFSMAWIGVLDPQTQDGKVVAACGSEARYVDQIVLSARPDSPASGRPACTALRESRPVICNDIATDPGLAALAVNMLARGHRAVAALPLLRHGQAYAVMVLCVQTVGFFDADEIKLLGEVADDLDFALQFIDNAERLSYLAYYDALTGLANARLFEDRLAQMLNTTRTELHRVGVIMINLDRFGRLNDALGRPAGDAILQLVAQRLEQTLRGRYSLARIGGANFAIAIGELPHGEDAVLLLEQQVFAALAQGFRLAQQEVRISARAGLALFPADGGDAETLFKHAEVALKNAKASGDRYLYYSPAMNAAHAAKLGLETELQRALDEGEFVIYYQPRVDLLSGRIVSAEALIRWQHPERGLVFPGTFIPLAEEIGLIVPIGDWVIDAVYAQQASWQQAQLDIVPVAVNLSAVQFHKGRALHSITAALANYRLAARHVEFELTESMVMNNPEEAARNLIALKELGIQLALDDFGTGYSSLAYLQRFPFDIVKIDRAFITDITSNPGNAAIATAVIAMAHSLNLRVVAEGVETEGQVQFLRKQGCDEIQGFYFSAAVPAQQFERMLRDKKQLQLAQDGDEDGDALLIVDDEPHNLSALRRLLRREGYRVLAATSGQSGLDMLAVNRVQVIISDQRMPGMSGTEFLRIAKQLYPDTVRIILSGDTDLDVVTDSVNHGAVFKFMSKPWDDAELRASIRDAFRLYRKRSAQA